MFSTVGCGIRSSGQSGGKASTLDEQCEWFKKRGQSITDTEIDPSCRHPENPIELALATQAAIPTIRLNLAETELAPMNPPSQGYVAHAYDIESDRVILFGGQTGTIDSMSG